VMFAIRCTAMADELGPDNPHTLLERVRDPNDQVVHEMQGEFQAAAEGDVRNPDWLQGLSLPAGAQFAVELEGTYTVTHQVDGASEHSLPLHVSHNFPPGFEPPPDA
jgi:hypothetical protein